MPYSMQQTQTQQPKAAQRQQHAVFKNTYSQDAVLPNEKDEPKMTKARYNLCRRCRYLQCVRDGEGGAAVAAPIKPETKTKIKTKQTQQPKAAQRQQHALFKNTYRRDAVFPNEKDEPKMTKARCTLRRRRHFLQCVRDGEGGAAVVAPIKPKSKSKSNKSVRNVFPPQYNNRKFSSQKAIPRPQHAVSKTLTGEKQYFQMRNMNQR
jgi:hypothetical protein